MLHQERHFGEQLEALGVEILNNKANNSGHIDRKLVSGQPGGRQQLRADGGQSNNPFVMQFQADMLDRPVEVASITETTALGAAFLAGRGVGLWRSDSEIESLWKASSVYEPSMSESERLSLYSGWLEALRKATPRI